ncbi:hypothetical protein ACTJKU_04385, partial [Citrobacter freundii]
MDVAKVIVSVFASKLAGRTPVLFLSSFIVTSAAVPVWGEIVCAVALGFFIAYILNEVDEKYELSDKLIACICEGMKEQQKIAEWNSRHSGYSGSLYGGIY